VKKSYRQNRYSISLHHYYITYLMFQSLAFVQRSLYIFLIQTSGAGAVLKKKIGVRGEAEVNTSQRRVKINRFYKHSESMNHCLLNLNIQIV
jgi:hypothetical protein